MLPREARVGAFAEGSRNHPRRRRRRRPVLPPSGGACAARGAAWRRAALGRGFDEPDWAPSLSLFGARRQAQLECGFDELTASREGLLDLICCAEEARLRSELEAAAAAAAAADGASNGGRADPALLHEVLEGAQVICCQMISAGGPLLSKLGPFHAILVDEVAQATEPATLVPVLARGCSQLVLCGDHFQLPPSCASREALARGLGLSGYERLVSQGTEPLCLGTVMEPFHDPSWHLPAGVEPLFLDTQFRAHPKLMDFSCDAIYGGRLRSGIDSRRAARSAGRLFTPAAVNRHRRRRAARGVRFRVAAPRRAARLSRDGRTEGRRGGACRG